MEVGRSYELPLQAIATSNAVGCLKPTDKHQVVCTPAKYTCTKCQSEHGSTDELHSHLIVCGMYIICMTLEASWKRGKPSCKFKPNNLLTSGYPTNSKKMLATAAGHISDGFE